MAFYGCVMIHIPHILLNEKNAIYMHTYVDTYIVLTVDA